MTEQVAEFWPLAFGTRIFSSKMRVQPMSEMRTELGILDAGLAGNADVRLGERRGKSWITLTPLDAQPEPDNIIRLKAELQSKCGFR